MTEKARFIAAVQQPEPTDTKTMKSDRIKSKQVIRVEIPFDEILRFRDALVAAKLELESIGTANSNRYNRAQRSIEPLHEIISALV